ncbi:hypothetical protein [Actinoallomurus acaciae]|uniref:Uncharacterized protein n=1 Tax=Actinoallomurus acaciae TaxID=502577 RepID=A0ABV5YD02_9ACTN
MTSLGSHQEETAAGPPEERSNPEVEALSDLFRRLTELGLDLDSTDTRLAIVISGPEPLALSIDRPGEFFLWHEVKETHPVTESAQVARLVVERLGLRSSSAGE